MGGRWGAAAGRSVAAGHSAVAVAAVAAAVVGGAAAVGGAALLGQQSGRRGLKKHRRHGQRPCGG